MIASSSSTADESHPVIGYCLACSHALVRNTPSRCTECGRAFQERDPTSLSTIPLHRHINMVIGSAFLMMALLLGFDGWMIQYSLMEGVVFGAECFFVGLVTIAAGVFLPALVYGLLAAGRRRIAAMLMFTVLFSIGVMPAIWIWQIPLRLHFMLVRHHVEAIAESASNDAATLPARAGLWTVHASRTDENGVLHLYFAANLSLIREDQAGGVVLVPWGNIRRIVRMDEHWSIVIDD